MNQIENVVNLMQNIQKQIRDSNRKQLYDLTSQIKSILERFYSTESVYHRELGGIRNQIAYLLSVEADSRMGRNITDLKDNFNCIITSILSEVSILGFPSSNDIQIDRSVNVNVSQNQEQGQSQEQIQEQISELLIDLIKDEITGQQLKEVKEILIQEKNLSKAKKSIIQKIGTFGGDVAANIVANILTNPIVWSGIIK